MSPSAESPEFSPRPDAVIAGTLCLMSCYVAHPVPLYAERVKENLGKLSDLTGLSPELRLVCRRLSERRSVC